MTTVDTVPPPSPRDRPDRPLATRPSASTGRPSAGSAPAALALGHAEPRAWDRRELATGGRGVMTCSVRPAPDREPSFDDEPRSRHLYLIPAAASPQLPFPQASSAPVPALFPAPPPQLEPARRLTVVPDLPEPALVAARPASPTSPATEPAPLPAAAPLPSAAPLPVPGDGHRPDPSRFSRQFAQGVVEVLSGRRPMVQLTRHVSPAVQRGLTRAGGSHPLKSPNAPSLHSLHLSEPAAGVCEMSAIVVVGARYRALAARLEWKIDHWRCTALQIG